jgi:hypothetical protein
MNLKELSNDDLNVLLLTYKSVSMGVRDIVFVHAIQDELDDRRHGYTTPQFEPAEEHYDE